MDETISPACQEQTNSNSTKSLLKHSNTKWLEQTWVKIPPWLGTFNLLEPAESRILGKKAPSASTRYQASIIILSSQNAQYQTLTLRRPKPCPSPTIPIHGIALVQFVPVSCGKVQKSPMQQMSPWWILVPCSHPQNLFSKYIAAFGKNVANVPPVGADQA